MVLLRSQLQVPHLCKDRVCWISKRLAQEVQTWRVQAQQAARVNKPCWAAANSVMKRGVER